MAEQWITERMIIVGTAFFLDLLLGDPHLLWHPVRGIGSIISGTQKALSRIFKLGKEREEDKEKKLAAGVLLVVVTLFLSVGIPMLLLYGAERLHPYLRLGLESIMCYQLLAVRSLKKESMKVYTALREGNVQKAREAVSMIVGRDTEQLKEEGIIKAAVETVAENTSDGVIAPLFYMVLFGAVGGFFYKAVNTMDSMVGYKNDTYYYLGRPAARLDDICSFLPARIAAVFMIAVSFLLGMNYKNAAAVFKRDRYCHGSPNSAQTEAVCAGALSVQLGGDAWYFGELYHKPVIGNDIRKVEIEDIRRANRLLYGTSFFMLFACICLLAALRGLI